MAIGPVQLLVIGFQQPDFRGEILEELEKLRESDTLRVIDSLSIYKDAAGEIAVLRLSNLTEEEATEVGSKVAALIGLGIEVGMETGAETGVKGGSEGADALSDEDVQDALDDIPNDSAAALLLIEHHWAVGLRDAAARAGGFSVDGAFISPLDLVAIGMLSAEEAKELQAQETQANAATS